MTNLDKEFLKIYNRFQQVSVIIENVFKLNHKIIEVFTQNSEFASIIYLKTNEVIGRRITLLEELAAIFTKLHEIEIGKPKIDELVRKAKALDEEYRINREKIIKRGEFETQENKLLVEEIGNLEVEIKNFMSILAERIDEKKLKLEQKNDKK